MSIATKMPGRLGAVMFVPRFAFSVPVIASALCVPVIVGVDQADARPTYAPSVVVSAGTGYSRNPYLTRERKKNSTARGSIEISPRLAILSDRQTVSIDSYYRLTDYTRRGYSVENSFGGRLSASRQVSTKMALTAYVGYDRSRVGTYDGSDVGNFIPAIGKSGTTGTETGGTGTVGAGTTATGTGTVGPASPGGSVTSGVIDGGRDIFSPGDLGLLGQKRYRELFSAGFSANGSFDARNEWNLGFNTNHSRYTRQSRYGEDSYWNYVPSFGVSRRLSDTRSVGLQMSISRLDYRGNSSDAWVYTPQVVGNFRFKNGWAFNGGIGASVTRRTQQIVGRKSRTNFSGEGSLCRALTRTTFCMGGSHNAGVSSGSGISEITTVYTSYGYKLSERNSIGATVTFYRNSGGETRTDQPLNRTRYLSAGLSYDHQLTRRLRLVATVAYNDVYRRRFNTRSDMAGRLTLVFETGIIR